MHLVLSTCSGSGTGQTRDTRMNATGSEVAPSSKNKRKQQWNISSNARHPPDVLGTQGRGTQIAQEGCKSVSGRAASINKGTEGRNKSESIRISQMYIGSWGVVRLS